MPIHRQKPRPIVALVGRANAGKSTLWNRLTETGRAIVSNVPHTTRDRNYAPVLWRGLAFDAVDTGGMDADQGNEVGRGILRQAELAIKEADLVLFMVDARRGAAAEDVALARAAKALNKNVLLVANKIDSFNDMGEAHTAAMARLGLGEAFASSATTGRNTGDLLDLVHEQLFRLGKGPIPLEDPLGLKIAVVGRPNVGKSSLVNAILGEERVVASPIAHTTREPIDSTFEWEGERITIVDTAGMRRQSKVERGLETEGIERNLQTINRADIALLVVEANEIGAQQDRHLAGELKEMNKGVVIVVNKWDLVEDKATDTVKGYEAKIRLLFPFLKWAPIVFVSALERQRCEKLIEIALRVREERRREISYNALQRLLKTVVARHKPMADTGAFSPYVHDVAQAGVEPPRFTITVRGGKGSVHPNWVRYFENRLREKFGFEGTPIDIRVRITPISDLSERNPEGMKRPQRRKRPIGRKGTRY